MKKAIKPLFPLLLVIFTLSSALAADKINNPEIKTIDNYIAVFDFEVTTGDKSISRPLADSIIHEFSTYDRYKVIDRGNMNKILSKQKFQMSGCVAQECKVEAGQLLGVGKIVSGSVGIVGKTYYLMLQFIDIRTGEILNSVEDECKCEIDELLGSTRRLAKKLIAEQGEQPVIKETKPATIAESKAEEIVKAEEIERTKVKAEVEAAAKAKAEEMERIKAQAESVAAAKAEGVARAKAEAEEVARAKTKAEAEEIVKAKAKANAKVKAEEIEKAEAKQHGLMATNPVINPAVVRPKIISSDGRFEKLARGVVRDKQSGLDWYAGPDKDTGCDDANQWAAGLRVDGGGWRMPTLEELKGLYQKGAGTRNMTSLMETTGWWVWSVNTPGPSSWGLSRSMGRSLALDFDDGSERLDNCDISSYKRGFAVRSQR